MSYNKALVSSKQKAMIKSITDLLEVLSEIAIDDTGGNGGEIVLGDGSVMTLSVTADKGRNLLNIDKISVTNARLNLDIIVSKAKQGALSQDDNVIRLVKRKSSGEGGEKIRLVLKKNSS
jgi:hypothetical protein